MAKKISKNEVSEADVFGLIGSSAEKNMRKLEALDEQLKEVVNTTKSVSKVKNLFSQKEINQFMQSISKVNKLKSQAEEVDKKRVSTKRTLVEVNQKLLIEQQKQKEVKRQATLQAKQIAKLHLAEKNSIEALRAKLGLVTTAWTKLTKEEQENTKRGKRLTESKKKLTQSLIELERKTGDNRRNVGNYGSALDKLGLSFRKVTSLAAQFGLAMGGMQLVRGAATSIADFGQSVADLSAITGASGKDLQFYKDQAIEMGKTTKGGATQVVEAFKLIGSAKPELLENKEALAQVTEAAITLSKAAGLDVPDAATRLTDAMNQFGAPAEEAGRFIDVLANGAKFGSAEIPQVTDALLKFGAVAKTSNVSIEESTALIELLAEKGLKGAEAGTGLRNVMLKLAAPDALPKEAKKMMEDLGISFETLQDTSLPFSKRLEAMKPLLKDNAALQKVFGKENAVTAINLLSSTERIDDLNEKMHENGTASDQAATRSKTLGEAFANIGRAWESFVLKLADGQGMNNLIDFLDSVARNLPTIIKWMGRLVKVFIIYKTITSDTVKKVALFAKMLKKTGVSLKGLTKAFKDGGKSAKNMGKAFKSIGFSVLITLAIEFATALYDIATQARAAREEAEALNKAKEDGVRVAEIANAQQEKRIKLREDEIALALAERKISPEQAIKDRTALYKHEIGEVNKLINANHKKLDTLRSERAEINRNIRANEKQTIDSREGRKLQREARARLKKELLSTQTQQTLLIAQNNALAGSRQNLRDVLKGLNIEEAEHNSAIKEENNSSKIQARQQRVVNTEFKNQIDLLSELNELYDTRIEQQKTLNEIGRAQDIEALDRLIEKEKEYQLARIESDMGFNPTVINDLIKQRRDLEIQGIEESRQFDIDSAKKAHERKFADMLEALESERDALLSQEKATEDERQKIKDNFNVELDKLNAIELESEEVLQGKITNINAAADAEILASKQTTNDSINDADKDLTDALIERNNELVDADKDKNDKIQKQNEQHQKELQALMEESGTQILDGFINRSKKRESIIDDEIKKSQALEDQLRESAQNQNAVASESLAAQENFTKERIRAKEEEQRKQRQLDEIKLIYQAVLQFMDQGDSPIQATTKALATSQIIRKAVEAIPIPGFFKGTKGTVKDELGAPMLSGKDGYVVRVDGSEKVLNPHLSSLTGGATTDEIVDGFLFSKAMNNGMLVNDYVLQTTNKGMDLKPLEDRLDQLTKVVKNKKETTFHDDVLLGISKGLVRIENEGNTRTRTQFKS